MKPGAPWSVKGVDPAAREAAKAAAQAAGMSLGVWLNHMIEQSGRPVTQARPEPDRAAAPRPAPVAGAAAGQRPGGEWQSAVREIAGRLVETEKRIAGVIIPLRQNVAALQQKIQSLESSVAELRAAPARHPDFTEEIGPAPLPSETEEAERDRAAAEIAALAERADEMERRMPPPSADAEPPRARAPRLDVEPFERSSLRQPTGYDDDAEGGRLPVRAITLSLIALIVIMAIVAVAWLGLREFNPTGQINVPIPGRTPAAPQSPTPRVAPPAVAPTPAPVPAPAAPPPGGPADPARRSDATPGPDPAAQAKEAASRGNPAAQFALGQMYYEGSGVARDPVEAARWFQRAADQGNANAQHVLGEMYDKGLGVKEDPAQALFWFAAAAEQNNVIAMFRLATLYGQGRGTTQDFVQARKWFDRAGQYGHANALFNLGVMAERGLAGRQDDKAAYRWYVLAARQGDRGAAAKKAELAARLGPAETATQDAQVAQWTPKPLPGSGPALPSAPPRSAGGVSVVSPAQAGPTIALSVGKPELQRLQALLTRLGFDTGPADGNMGDRTRRAIMDYQKAAGMVADGTPTRNLLDELERVAGPK